MDCLLFFRVVLWAVFCSLELSCGFVSVLWAVLWAGFGSLELSLGCHLFFWLSLGCHFATAVHFFECKVTTKK